VGDAIGRLFAIGDVHGCATELAHLLDALPATTGDTVVFVGDYIDRGSDSRAVIDLLLDWRTRTSAKTVFLKGNHEDMALGYLGRGGQWGEAWLRNGGVAALRSYGIDPNAPRSEVTARLPPNHLDFLAALEMRHVWRDYRVVHAGVRPGVSWNAQRIEDLLWIREEFLDHPHDLGATVIFGHTPHRRVVVEPPYRLGVDTGCVYGGMLSCVMLPDEWVYQVRLGDPKVLEHSLATASRRRS
jgi:serine/threonine protein phosphatase 1